MKYLVLLILAFASQAQAIAPRLFRITDIDNNVCAYAIGSVHDYPYAFFKAQYNAIAKEDIIPGLEAFGLILMEESSLAPKPIDRSLNQLFNSYTCEIKEAIYNVYHRNIDLISLIKQLIPHKTSNDGLLKTIYLSNEPAKSPYLISQALAITKYVKNIKRLNEKIEGTPAENKKEVEFAFAKELFDKERLRRTQQYEGIDSGIAENFTTQPIIVFEEEIEMHREEGTLLRDLQNIMKSLQENIFQPHLVEREIFDRFIINKRNHFWMPKIIDAIESHQVPLFCFGLAHFTSEDLYKNPTTERLEKLETLDKLLAQEGFRLECIYEFEEIID